jgi:hypothetical protein
VFDGLFIDANFVSFYLVVVHLSADKDC